MNHELGENEVFIGTPVLPQKVSPPPPVTNDVPASVDVQPSVISDTAAKRPRPDSEPSSLRLSPASKKVIYDGEEAVYTFEDDPPFWVPMIFKIMDKVHQNVSQLKESFDTVQAMQKSFEEYRTVTDQKIQFLEAAAEGHKSTTAQSLLSLQSRESAAAERISIAEKKAEKKTGNTSNRPRAIIVKFSRYNIRASVFREKKKLKGTKIMLTESLTSH